MKKYQNIYFDLDRTLWDFDTNSSETLLNIVDAFDLYETVPDTNEFIQKYHVINNNLWVDYKAGKIKKSDLRIERFISLLSEYNIHDKELAYKVNRYFLNENPTKKVLIPGAIDILQYLSDYYQIYIISNGFYDVQLTKIISSGISRYVSKVFTSDRLGAAKPSKEFFSYSLTAVNARKSESIVIGDDEENDVIGALNSGIDAIYYNPENLPVASSPTYVISSLTEISGIL